MSENLVNTGADTGAKTGVSVQGKKVPISECSTACFLHVRLVTASLINDDVAKKDGHPFKVWPQKTKKADQTTKNEVARELEPVAMYVLYSGIAYVSEEEDLKYGTVLGSWIGRWQDEKDEKERWKDTKSPLHGWWKMTFDEAKTKWDLSREGMAGRTTLDGRKTPDSGKVSLYTNEKAPADDNFLTIQTEATWHTAEGTKWVPSDKLKLKKKHTGEGEGIQLPTVKTKSFTKKLAGLLGKNKDVEVLVEKPLLWYPDAGLDEKWDQKAFENSIIADAKIKTNPGGRSGDRFKYHGRMMGGYRYGYPEGIIVHYTAGHHRSFEAGHGRIKSAGFLYFLINAEGKVLQTAPLNRWGDHCGESSWKEIHSKSNWISKYTVGIEVMNAGMMHSYDKSKDSWIPWWEKKKKTPKIKSTKNLRRVIGEKDEEAEKKSQKTNKGRMEYIVKKQGDNLTLGVYHKYTDAQEKSLRKLIEWLYRNNPRGISLDYLLGHDEISPGRKQDPGGALSINMPKLREKLKEAVSKDKKPKKEIENPEDMTKKEVSVE